MKKWFVLSLRVSISILFFFTLWVGSIYLTEVIFGEEKFTVGKFLSAFLMALIFTYMTNCGAIFSKFTISKKI